MSKIRAFVLALLVSMFAFFAGCDDDDAVEEEPQAGQEVECVVSEEETCVEEVDSDAPEEVEEEEVDMEVPVEEEPVEDPVEEPTEEDPVEDPVEEVEEEEASESDDPAAPAGEEMPG